MKTIDEAIFDVLADETAKTSSEIKELVYSINRAKKNSVMSVLLRLVESGQIVRSCSRPGRESKYRLGNIRLEFGVSKNIRDFNRLIQQARSA